MGDLPVFDAIPVGCMPLMEINSEPEFPPASSISTAVGNMVSSLSVNTLNANKDTAMRY